MNIELLCQNNEENKLYDISTLAESIEYETTLSAQPGKLTLTLQEDLNKIFQVYLGSSVLTLNIDGRGIFYGYIFKVGTDAKGTYKIIAYDQTRYLKNQDVKYVENKTASQLFEEICVENQLKYKIKTNSNYITPEFYYKDKTYFAMIERSSQLSNIAEGKQYFIRDNFGTIEFTELGQFKTNLIIGDKSLMTSYQYEVSIDDDTYNTVKIYRDNKETGLRDVWVEFDSNNIKRWGKLQTIKEAQKEQNEAQIRELATNLLKWKNRPTTKLKLTAIGTLTPEEFNVVGYEPVKLTQLQAGYGFLFSLEKLKFNQYMWITSVTHNFKKDLHTMSFEVSL